MALQGTLGKHQSLERSFRLDRWSVMAGDADPREVFVPAPATALDWADWDESGWETIWTWTTSFDLDRIPPFADLEIGAVLGPIRASVNGVQVGSGESGFLPLTFDVAGALRIGANSIEIVEDARWRRVPPMGSPLGAGDVDFFLPAGINRPIILHTGDVAPLRNLVVRSADLLTDDPAITVGTSLPPDAPLDAVLAVRLTQEGTGELVAQASAAPEVTRAEAAVTLRPGPNLDLWSPASPALYRIEVELQGSDGVVAAGTIRTGFREVAWNRDGLLINGLHQRVIGLNRHELFPFVGFAASDRAQRADARMLKEQLGVDLVRCSHYPQSEAFLDACDELGLLVFEEAPGWQYAGTTQRDPSYDDPWQPVPASDRDPAFEAAHLEQFVRMVERDRHRPSVVVWGAFLNETRAYTPDLWEAVIAEARRLDPERALSGATRYRRNGHEAGSFDSAHDAEGHKVWPFDVFGYNDYHLDENDLPEFMGPVDDYPYLVTEAVGQMPHFREWFTRGTRSGALSRQALFHAVAIEHAFADDVIGVISWVAFDYPSPHGAPWGSREEGLGPRGRSIKVPGVADIFRIVKPAAAIYRAQRDPEELVVLEAAFVWDLDVLDDEPLRFASNCDELVVTVDGAQSIVLTPDRAAFPRTPHPFFVMERPIGATQLDVVGRIKGHEVAELHLTNDPTGDRLDVRVDDGEIRGDGVDSTRVAFQVSDRFGNLRATAAGAVRIDVAEPGILIGPDYLDVPGSAAAIWIRAAPGSSGIVNLHVHHPTAGSSTATVAVSTAS